MGSRRRLVCSLTLAAALTAAAPQPRAEEAVTLFAAASLTEVSEALAEAYAATGQTAPRGVFAASSTLAKQIERGAPADLYVSANPQWMDYLEERGLIAPGTRVDLLQNQLALVVPSGSPIAIGATVELEPGFDLAALLDSAEAGGRLAIGDPSHVPAGIYAKAALQHLGLWKQVEARTANAANVRAALALVERRAAVAGIVYVSDAMSGIRVRVIATLPPASHPPIRYPLAIVAGRDRPEVRDFYDYLRSERAGMQFLIRLIEPLYPGG